MKKKILFPLLFFLSVLLLREEITNLCIKKITTYYITHEWQSFFQCDLFEKNEKGWVLNNVHIKKKDKFDIDIQSLQMTFHFDLSTFQLFIHLDLNSPKINVFDPHLKLKRKNSRIHTSINVEKGQLNLLSKNYFFTCKQKPFSKERVLSFEDRGKSYLEISQNPFGFVNCAFHDFDLYNLQEFQSFFLKKHHQKIRGKLSGNCSFSLGQMLQDFSYDLICQDLSVDLPSTNGCFQAEKIKLKGKYPKSRFALLEDSLDKAIQKINISAYIENGSFQSIETYTDKISGDFSYTPQIGPKLNIKAIGQVNGKQIPIQIQGKGFFHPIFSNWLEGKIQFGNMDSGIFLTLKEIEKTSLKMHSKGKVDYLSVCYVQKILSSFYKKTLQVSLKKGNIDFECTGKWVLSNPISLNGRYLSGYLNIQDGAIILENPECSFEDVETNLEVISGRICPSKIMFKSDHVQGDIYVQGKIENPLLQAKIKGPVYPILDKIPFLKEKFVEYSSLYFQLGCTLKREGFFGTFQFQNSQKKMLDSFSFGFILQDFLEKKRINIRHGWVKGKQIQLDKYNVPLKGMINVFATFENKRMQMLLSGQTIEGTIHGTHFKMKQLGSRDKELFNAKECAQIQYDFSDQKLSIEVPLNNEICNISKYDLHFSEIYGKLSYSDHLLTVDVGKTKCEQANFSGVVLLENKNKRLQVLTKKAKGSISSLFQILSKLSIQPPLLEKLSGTFESSKDGFYLTTVFNDPKIPSQFKLQAKIYDGTFSISERQSLQKLQAKIFANSLEESIHFEQVKAKLFIQSEKNQQVCDIYIPLLQKRKEHCHFDVRVSRPLWDIARFVGSFHKKDSLYGFFLDNQQTHFLGEKLNVEECILEDFSKVFSLKMNTNVDLSSLISQSALLNEVFFPEFSLDFMRSQSLRGKIYCEVQYGPKRNSKIKLSGKDLWFNQKKIDQCLVEAVQKGKVWDFSKILVGSLHAKGLLSYQNSQIAVENFIANLPEVGSIKISCRMRDHFQISGDIDSLNLKIDVFNQIFQKDLQLRGNIQGTGRFSIDLPYLDQKWQIDSDLDIKTSTLLSKEFALENIDPLQIYFSLQEGLVIQGLNLHLFHPNDSRTWMKCKVGRLYNKAKEKKYLFSDLQLYLPKENLKDLIKKQDWITRIKKEVNWLDLNQDLEICANGSFDANYLKCFINIHEHHLHLKNQTYFLRDLCVSFQPNKIEGDCKVKHVSKYVPLGFLINIKEMIDGNLHFKGKDQVPLTLQWTYDEGVQIQSIEGSFQGIHASFHKLTQDLSSPFIGSLKMDLEKASDLAPPLLAQFFTELNMKDGYEFMGKLQLSPFSFEGIFSGRDCALAGYVFKTLLSSIHITKNMVQIKDFKISDKSGIFKIDQIHIEKNPKDSWIFSIPHIQIKEFRPSFLQKKEQKESPIKPLVIRDLNIYNLHGDLEDKNSYRGKGDLKFINSFKREHTLLDIPADVLGRIFGLDMELLIPTRGFLEFDIHDQKFFIHSLKEVYSEGKRSKFFLVDEKNPHTLDFDGNLNVYIQMKHFVLFKFTEPFILSVEGPLKDPNFSLRTKKSFLLSK